MQPKTQLIITYVDTTSPRGSCDCKDVMQAYFSDELLQQKGPQRLLVEYRNQHPGLKIVRACIRQWRMVDVGRDCDENSEEVQAYIKRYGRLIRWVDEEIDVL